MVEPRAPRTPLKIVNLVFWLAMVLTATAFGLALGLNVILVPFWFFGMAGAVSVTARRAWNWTCPKCHEEMEAPRVVTTPPLVPQHA
jgi:hypothetical protein